MNEDFHVLRQQNSVRVPAEVRAQHLALLKSMGEPAALNPRKWRRPRAKRLALIAGTSVVLLGAGVGTAAAFGAFATPSERGVAHCYATADLNDDGNHTNFAWADRAGSSIENGDAARAAMEVCSSGWSQGRFHTTDPKVTDPDPAGHQFPVPKLTPCVLKTGAVGVMPGPENVCAQLGLAIADFR
jgi:hypothetical protein